ncbi:MAG: tetratricopeptide repeat protein [Gemmatimonadetes bacterium]|nr:tetratricopeptide repeat protein [Gemmatimonadota bacterium]
MSATSRVDDLRKRYHENPRRFFAPLANEYRKTGFTDRAILLCEKHLGEQPGNMNGLIVYGQCLFETGRLDEARVPFEAALAVDPENLIALRHLGDIARLGMDHESARGWYQRVLEFDRRNDEVIALLAEVGGGAEEAPAPSIAPNIISVNSSVSVGSAMDSIGMVDLGAPTARPSIAPPVPILGVADAAPAKPVVDSTAKTVEVSAQGKPAKRGSLFDLNFDFGEGGAEAPAAARQTPRSVPQAPPPAAPPRTPTPVMTPIAAPEPTKPPLFHAPMGSIIEHADEQGALSDMPAVEGLQLADFGTEVVPLAELESHEFAGGDADALDGLESLDFSALNPDVRAPVASIAMDHMSKADLVDEPAPDLPMLPAFGEPEPPADRASATAGLPLLPSLEEAETIKIDVEDLRRRFETPATFVTETMAALYVQQGLHDKAVDVYRQLIAQSPDDQGLKDRLHALEHPVEVAAAPPEPSSEPVVEAQDEFPEFEPEPLEAPATAAAPAPRTTAPRVTLDFETPVASDPVDPPAPPNAMLSEISFADVSLTTPHDPARRSPTPPVAVAVAVEPDAAFELRPELEADASVGAAVEASHERVAAASGPSAREFFGAFARRVLTPLSMMVVSAVPSAAGGPLSPLDEIFGLHVDPNDESSAHRLAAIGATSGPSGGSALDSVFGEGPSAPMPPESPSATPPRGSVPRASTKLRFDQFFASSVPSATPSSATPVPATEAVSEPESAPEPQAATGEQAAGDDDDLDQFQGWLRRLTQ